MDFLSSPALRSMLSAALLGVAGASVWLCVQKFHAAIRRQGDYRSAAFIVRGIRWLVIALTALAWAAGLLWNAGWLFIIGLVFIGQELYECAFLSAAVREGRGVEKGGRFP